MHFKLLSALRKLLWKHPQAPNLKTRNKMADSSFVILNQSNVGQLKENSKNQNTLNATQT